MTHHESQHYRKILERLAMNQMRRHMENLPNLGPLQSAYRALHSTETAMTKVVNDLLFATASISPSVLLSLDIRAAFDTLDHHRLLEWAKDLFGSDSTVLQWCCLYLVGREQFVGVTSCYAPNGKVVLRHTAGLGSRATALLHLHDTGWRPHLHIWNTVPPIRRRHTIVHGHRYDVTNRTGNTLRMCRCSRRMAYQKRSSQLYQNSYCHWDVSTNSKA